MTNKRRRLQRGSTVVEVLMAISVLAVGAAGILALQKVTVVANKNAKNLEIANEIARTWVERLHADAMLWNFDSSAGSADIDTDTRWLALNVNPPGNEQWFRPMAPGLSIYGVHDSFGKDDPSGQSDGPFCVNLRLTWLKPDQDVARVEVRVYWLRENLQGAANESTLTIAPPVPLCSIPVPDLAASPDVFHSVHVTTAVVMNKLR